jgi:hypothetical protein
MSAVMGGSCEKQHSTNTTAACYLQISSKATPSTAHQRVAAALVLPRQSIYLGILHCYLGILHLGIWAYFIVKAFTWAYFIHVVQVVQTNYSRHYSWLTNVSVGWRATTSY